MSQWTDRMIRAARLDPALYEEVEADRSSLGQAMAVVILASVAHGIGNLGDSGGLGLFTGTLTALVAWFLWAFLTYWIGTRVLPQPQTHADLGELLRTTGFSAAPGVLRLFGFIPVVGVVIVLVASLWMLIAFIIAVRQALDYTSSARAIGVCLIGWLVMVLTIIIVGGLAGGLGSLTGGGGGGGGG